jgi:MOSC domain-containing protein YiiM
VWGRTGRVKEPPPLWTTRPTAIIESVSPSNRGTWTVKLLSVSVSQPKAVPYRGNTVQTGIFKEPVAGRVALRRLGLHGDRQVDLRYHGGVNKAVYAYPFEHYATWAAELGRDDLAFGQFGENFTVEGMLEDDVRIGDVYRLGTAVVEVTQPRTPCFKLGIRMGMAGFPKLLLASGRTGFYLSVREEGEVAASDSLERLSRDPESLSIRRLWQLVYQEPDNVDDARKALRLTTLRREWREPLQERVFRADRGE